MILEKNATKEQPQNYKKRQRRRKVRITKLQNSRNLPKLKTARQHQPYATKITRNKTAKNHENFLSLIPRDCTTIHARARSQQSSTKEKEHFRKNEKMVFPKCTRQNNFPFRAKKATLLPTLVSLPGTAVERSGVAMSSAKNDGHL